MGRNKIFSDFNSHNELSQASVTSFVEREDNKEEQVLH